MVGVIKVSQIVHRKIIELDGRFAYLRTNNNLAMAESSWTYDQFLCFLLIYVSHVDMEFSSDEENRIKRLFDAELYTEIYSFFSGMSDYQALQEVMKYKDIYFDTPEKKQEIMDQVKIQFFVDGSFSTLEKVLFNFLEKIL